MFDHFVARTGIHVRKAKLNVAGSNSLPAFEKTARSMAQGRTKKIEQRVRKLNDEPEKPKSEPGQPVTRMEQRFIKSNRHQCLL
ncbi:hypothetical protein HMPREF0880_03932 [Yokenella regensburgei ATCC 43003]|nr:hypothetical protein HMPREF0880_03932 [Yokenella regensburgei ATCC 43003]